MSHSDDPSEGCSRPYVEELCTVGVTALLGIAVLKMYSNLNPYVFWSALAILSLAAYRTISLLVSIAQGRKHRRKPASIPWRCFVLILPVMLFFFGPPATSAKSIRARSQAQNAIHMTWDDLHAWAKDELKREWSEGRIGVVEGYLLGNESGRAFILEKYFDEKIFRVTVLSDQEIGVVNFSRVQVTGQIHYRKEGTDPYTGEERYNVILKILSQEDILSIAIDEP
jgi:hypothetical protein